MRCSWRAAVVAVAAAAAVVVHAVEDSSAADAALPNPCFPGCVQQYGHHLDCSRHNPMLVAPPNVSRCASTIDTVILSHNGIRRITVDSMDSYREKKTLTALKLDNNLISVIDPGAFDGMDALMDLELSGNRLRGISEMMFRGLSNLRALLLSNNQIDKLFGDSLKQLSGLKTLDISGNLPMVSFEETSFEHVTNLTSLFANALPNLTGSLPELLFETNTRVSSLSLVNNSLTEIPTRALSRVSRSLEQFRFGGNRVIRRIPENAFRNLTALTRLELLDMTALRTVDAEAFVDLPELDVFYVMRCPKLVKIDEDAFRMVRLRDRTRSKVFELSEVIIKHTALSTLSSRLLPWSGVGQVDLRSNPWRCDCGLRWMTELDPENLEVDGDEQLTCESPADLRGARIPDLTAAHLPGCGEGKQHTPAAARRRFMFTLVVPMLAVVVSGVAIGLLMWKCGLCQALKTKYYRPLYVSMYNMEVKRGLSSGQQRQQRPGGRQDKEMQPMSAACRQADPPDRLAEIDYRFKSGNVDI